MITSIFENTHSKVTAHILHNNTLTDDNRRKFLRTAQKYSQSVELVDVAAHEGKISEDFNIFLQKWGAGALYRLFIPDLFPNLHKVIYLDCDVLVGIDIADLWSIDTSGYSLAGAVDLPTSTLNFSIYKEKMRILLNGSRPETYINSGVLVMNLERIRQKGSLFKIASDWMLKRGRVAFAPDQDALNAVFKGDIKIISSRFNQNVLQDDMTNCIIHMLFSKAWQFSKGLYSDRLYWKMYVRSAWGENTTPDELIDIFSKIAHNTLNSPKVNKSYMYCFMRLLHGFSRFLLYRIIPTKALQYLVMDIYYRLKDKFSH